LDSVTSYKPKANKSKSTKSWNMHNETMSMPGWATSDSKSGKSSASWSSGVSISGKYTAGESDNGWNGYWGHKPKADKSDAGLASNSTHAKSEKSKSAKKGGSWSSGVSISGKYSVGEGDAEVSHANDEEHVSKSAKSYSGWSDSWSSGVSVSGKYAVEAKSEKSPDRSAAPGTMSKRPLAPQQPYRQSKAAKPRNDPVAPASASESTAPGTKSDVKNSKGLANDIAFSGYQQRTQDTKWGEEKSAASAVGVSRGILMSSAAAILAFFLI
jgi:hypothetical protein